MDARRYTEQLRKSHSERYFAEANPWGNQKHALPAQFPHHRSKQSQAHWLLARNPLAKLDSLYPVVWEKILNEKLSDLPVVQR